MFRYLQLHEIHYEMDFLSHPKLVLFYEDLLDNPEDTFRQAQSFLGVEPRRLAAPIRTLQELLISTIQILSWTA